MSTTHRSLTSLITAAAALLLLMVAMVAPSSAAEGAPSSTAVDAPSSDLPEIGEVFEPGGFSTAADAQCREDWCFETDWAWGGDVDPGGIMAWTTMWEATNAGHYYKALFDPYGEVLHVSDRFTDREQACAQVVVIDPATNRVVDRDSGLCTTYERRVNLGTPDGSGDIAEGLGVSIRVCTSETNVCSGWITGRA